MNEVMNLTEIVWNDDVFTIGFNAEPIANGSAATAETVCIEAAKKIAARTHAGSFSKIVLTLYQKLLETSRIKFDKTRRY